MKYSKPKKNKGNRTYRLRKKNILGMTTEEIQKDILEDVQSRKYYGTSEGRIDAYSRGIEYRSGITRVDLSKGRKTINDFWVF